MKNRPRKRVCLSTAVTTLVVVGVLACTGGGDAIVIGAVGNWRESYGAMSRQGIELAIADLNDAGGVRGQSVELRILDDSSDGAAAVAAASAFEADPRVKIVVGHSASGAMVAAAPVYDRGLVAITPAASSPDITGLSPWVFRVIASDSANGRDLARAASALKLTSAAILYENTAYGRGLADSFAAAFRGTIVARDPISPDSTASLEPTIAYINSRSPELVFVAGTSGTGLAVLREARKQNLSSQFMGGDGWTGLASAGPLAEGVWIGTPFAVSDSSDALRRFAESFRRRFGVYPDANAALAYDAARLAGQAIEEVGPARDAIRRWLSTLDAGAGYPGLTGRVRFSDGGDAVGRAMVLARVRGGVLRITPASAGAL